MNEMLTNWCESHSFLHSCDSSNSNEHTVFALERIDTYYYTYYLVSVLFGTEESMVTVVEMAPNRDQSAYVKAGY